MVGRSSTYREASELAGRDRKLHQPLTNPETLARWFSRLIWTLAAITVAACATYRPDPLPQSPDLKQSVPTIDAASLQHLSPRQAPHAINPFRPLDMTDVAILAVLENPDLKANRLKRGIANAQVFSAGLLPDPQLTLSIDGVTNPVPGLQTAYSTGLGYDIQAILLRGSKINSARELAAKVDLENLWQEWQVVQQARTLYTDLVVGRQKLALLRRAQVLYRQRYATSARALKRGDVSVETAGPDLVALLDVQTMVAQNERQLDQAQHSLLALMGLSPAAVVELAPLARVRSIPDATIDQALDTVASRRPDLLALQAGYRAQEAQVRQAILMQFPSVNVGLTRASDTSDVHTLGFGITINLPFLNANRGQIAIQRATRQALKQEYQARLDKTVSEVDQLRQRRRLLMRHLEDLDRQLPELEQMVGRARRGYAERNITTLVYLGLENSMLQKRIERLDLEQMLWTTEVALDTLLGMSVGGLHGAAGRPGL